MTTETADLSESEVPAWAEPLVAGAIKLDESTSDEALVNALGERLEALLRLFHCEATPDGWRSLALKLAAEREELRVITPVDRLPKAGGAEPGSNYWLGIKLKRDAKSLGSAKVAAEQEWKRNKGGPSVKRLQNLIADAQNRRLVKPRWMRRSAWESRIEKAMTQAAGLLEEDQSQN